MQRNAHLEGRGREPRLGEQAPGGQDPLDPGRNVAAPSSHFAAAEKAPHAVHDELGLREVILRAPDELLRAIHLAVVDDDGRELAAGLGADRTVGQRGSQRVSVGEHPVRAGVLVLDHVLAAEGQEHLDVVFVRVAVPAFDDLLGTFEQVAGREGRAGGSGVGKHEGVQIDDCLGEGELAKREVPLLFGAFRLPVGPLALRLRASRLLFRMPRLGDRRHQSADEGGQRERRQQDRRAVAPHELCGAVGRRVRARADRLMREVPPDVVGQVGHGGVPLCGVLLQGPGDDRVEVAAKLSPQALGSRGSGGGVLYGARIGRPLRVRFDDRLEQQSGRGQGRFGRMPPGEEEIEQRAEGEDVGGGRDRAARDLLGSGVFGRQRPAPFPGQRRRLARAPIALEQLRDPEVQQLDLAVRPDEYVGRLDVPVHDQVGMRMGDRGGHVEEKTKTRRDVERLPVAVAVDLLAFDVLQHDVRLARRGHARVQEPGDVGMREPRQDAALAAEAFLAGAPHETRVEELDGRLALEAAIAAAREPDGPMPPWPIGETSV